MPLSLLLARLCEAWHVPPSVALQEYLNLPFGWPERILEAQAYADAYLRYQADPDDERLPRSEWIEWVKRIEFERAQEKIAAARAAEAAGADHQS